MLTAEQLAAYERDGAVTVDGPLSPSELDEAEAAWDRLHGVSASPFTNDGRVNVAPYEEPAYLSVMAHPWFEQVAQQLLRASEVHLWWGLSPHSRPPSLGSAKPDEELWAEGAHIDIQATLADWEASPRRMRVECWHWLNEVPVERGAMRVLLGSHRPLLRAWDAVLTPEHKAQLPRVHGLVPEPKEGEAAYPERLPPAPQGQPPWLEQIPTPMAARRGQVLLLCSSCLHSAWHNYDSVPRKAMGSAWAAVGVAGGLPASQLEGLKAYFPMLRERLPPERQHIVPAIVDDSVYFETDYKPLWSETFSWGDAKL